MNAPIRSMPELIQALRDRRDELQLTHETIDDITLLPDGYTSKLFAPVPMKNLGPKSFEAILEALGVAVVVVEDPTVSNRVRTKWENKRVRPVKKPLALPSPSMSPSMQNEVPLQLQVTPALQRLLRNKEWMKQIGARGGVMRGQKLSPRRRRQIAKKAAAARWKGRDTVEA